MNVWNPHCGSVVAGVARIEWMNAGGGGVQIHTPFPPRHPEAVCLSQPARRLSPRRCVSSTLASPTATRRSCVAHGPNNSLDRSTWRESGVVGYTCWRTGAVHPCRGGSKRLHRYPDVPKKQIRAVVGFKSAINPPCDHESGDPDGLRNRTAARKTLAAARSNGSIGDRVGEDMARGCHVQACGVRRSFLGGGLRAPDWIEGCYSFMILERVVTENRSSLSERSKRKEQEHKGRVRPIRCSAHT